MSYAWTLTASCQIDDSNNSSNVAGEVFTTLTPCDDVEGLITNILLDRATLNWEAVDGVDHYNLRFKLDVLCRLGPKLLLLRET